MKAIQKNHGSIELASRQHIKGSNGMINPRLYYYLLESELNDVLNHKLIYPDEYYFDPEPYSYVWLTFSPQWERYSAQIAENGRKGCNFANTDFAALAERYIPFRIQIDPRIPLYNWNNCLTHINASLSDISISIFNKQLSSMGLNPKQWRCSLEPIPSMHWLGIEYWDSSQSHWLPYPAWKPAESMICITDHEHAIKDLTSKLSFVESERNKFKSEVVGLKASVDSKDGRIASLESSNSKLQQDAEHSRRQYQSYLETHTESALEQKIKELEEEKESESFDKEGFKESLDKANNTIDEKDRAIDAQNGYVHYLQTLLRTSGIQFNEHYGHQNKKAA